MILARSYSANASRILCSRRTKHRSGHVVVYISDRARPWHQGVPQQLAGLRKKWPLAFPVSDKDVRPLAIDATDEIAAVKRWSLPYTLGVLSRWKMAPVYCNAILCYNQRIALDGSPAEMVDAKAKDLATKHLARLAAGTAAKKATKTAVQAVASAPPTDTQPPGTPKQLRDRVRASLLRRRT
jgi:sRNA-binding protein